MRSLRITARGWSVLVVSAAVGVIGRLLGSLELLCSGLAGAFAFLAALLFAAFSRRPRVHVERRLPAETFADERVTVELVATSGTRRTPTVAVHERTAPDTVRTFGLSAMRARQSRSITYGLDAGGRGVRLLGPCEIARADPLGFTRRTGVVGDTSALVVWPQPRIAELPDTYAKAEPVPAAVHRTGIERELSEIRPYVDGDELRRVHWRTTARTGQLMVRSDGEAHDRARPLVVVDARSGAHTAGSLELALALVCGYALNDAYAPRVLLAIRSGTTLYDDRDELLGALARVPPGGGRPTAVETFEIGFGVRPDLLVAGPYTETSGAATQIRGVLRCDANGSDYRFARPGAER